MGDVTMLVRSTIPQNTRDKTLIVNLPTGAPLLFYEAVAQSSTPSGCETHATNTPWAWRDGNLDLERYRPSTLFTRRLLAQRALANLPRVFFQINRAPDVQLLKPRHLTIYIYKSNGEILPSSDPHLITSLNHFIFRNHRECAAFSFHPESLPSQKGVVNVAE